MLGLDQFVPPHSRGSSHGETRLFREVCYEGTHYTSLTEASYDAWTELGKAAGRELMRPARALLIGTPDAEPLAKHLPNVREQTDRFEELTAVEMCARFPAFVLRRDEMAVLETRAGILEPEACIEALLSRARAAGAALRSNAPVLGWEAEKGGLRVRCEDAEYRARKLILAAGAWTSTLTPGLDLPLEVERTVQFWFEPTPASAETVDAEAWPAWVWEHAPGSSWYGFPRTARGIKMGLHRLSGRRADPNTVERTVGEDEEALMRRVIDRHMPVANGPRNDASVCMYTTTPDEAPILDRHPDCPIVAIFTGGSGHCFKFAPVLGDLLADLSADEEPAIDLAPYRIDRF